MSNVAANYVIQSMNAGQMLQKVTSHWPNPNGFGTIARIPWPVEFILDKLMERSNDCACEYARYVASYLKSHHQPLDTIRLPSGKLVVEDDQIFFYPSMSDKVFSRANYADFGEILCTYTDLLESL